MLVLHAGFRGRRLLLWGETPPAVRSPRKRDGAHPFCAGSQLIKDFLKAAGVRVSAGNGERNAVLLPTVRNSPVPSTPLLADLRSAGKPKTALWTVETFALDPDAALDLLCYCAGRDPLSPGVIAGADLTYWVAAMRFAGSLAARQQFLPALDREDAHHHARWRAAWLGHEGDRRRALANAIPVSARALTPELPADLLLTNFVDAVIDHIVRSSPPEARSAVGPSLHDRWLRALYSPTGAIEATDDELRDLDREIREWRRPIALSAEAPFRLCFRLEEPGPDDSNFWNVRYLLQARDDPSLLLAADVAWNSKSAKPLSSKYPGFHPREHLLLSLGQASTLCTRIEQSLKSAAPAGYRLDAIGAHEFLTSRAIALEEAGYGVMLPAWWTRKGTKARLSARAHVKSPFQKGAGLSLASLLDFEWQVSIGGERVTLGELRALAALKAPLVKFRGQWVQMSAEEIQAALDFWKKKGAGQITAREAVSLALGAAKPAGPIEFAGVTAEGWLADLLEQIEGRTPFEELPPPAGLRATLRPYQVRGYSWLAFVRRWGLGACLADDMGLGKTIQTLSLIERDRHDGLRGPVLLICPTSVVGNWQKEAERFTPELAVLVHHGLARAKGEQFVARASECALVISTYALIHRDYEHLNQVHWTGIVLDEAQNIKNPETRQSAAARSLPAGFRIALTGTPVENNVGDLWSIMEFLNPGLLGSRAGFKRDFYLPIQEGRDPEASARLKKIIGPFILRRLKTDKSIIADLPDKLEMKVFCTLTKEQASLYAAVVKASIETIERAEGMKRKGVVLATLARLKQVCNHPAHFLGDNSPLPDRSGKLARLSEMLEEAISAGDRALIFTQFAEMGELLRRHLQETFGRETLFLHGAIPKPRRDRMVERFQNESDGPPVFILSLKAGGTGLNLTRASHVFHFDRWWNPAVENQATDRAFRIGQKRNVQVHKFVCAGTLEEKIDEMIERKKEIAAGVVGTGEGWLTELSTAHLRELLTLDKTKVAG